MSGQYALVAFDECDEEERTVAVVPVNWLDGNGKYGGSAHDTRKT
jgi:hypothetical protein